MVRKATTRAAITPREKPQSSTQIDNGLQDIIAGSVITQLQRWDAGAVKKLPASVEAAKLIGNNLNGTALNVAIGDEQRQEIYGDKNPGQELGKVVLVVGSAVDGTLNVGRGGDNVAQGNKDLRANKEGRLLNPGAQNAARNLALLFSRTVEAKGNNTLRVPERHWETPGLVSANSVEDLINGLNKVLDPDLQIDTKRTRSR